MTSENNAETTEVRPPFMSDKTYDTLKWIAQILLPALAVFYLALGGLWAPHVPAPEAVAGTIMAVDALLGVILGISGKQYQAVQEARNEQNTIGTVYVATNEDGTPDPHLEFKDVESMMNLGEQDQVVLNVTKI